MSDKPPQLTLRDHIQQSRERMRRIEAEIHETVRLTRAIINVSRCAIAEADRRLAFKAPEPLAKLFVVAREPS